MSRRGGRSAWALSVLLVISGMPAHAATFIDMAGRQVALQGPPHRIIPLTPSLTEILFALGAGGAVIGITDQDDYPPEVRGKTRVGGGLDPNLEVILTLRPDLVLATVDSNRWDTFLELERLGIPVFGVKPAGLEGVFTSIQKIGEVVGRPEQARELIVTMRRRMDSVSERVKNLPRPRILYVVWIDPLIVAGRATIIDDLIRMAGGENTVRASGFPPYGLEQVVAHPPDMILLGADHPGSEDGTLLRRLPAWKEMRAVREGAVRLVDTNIMHRPGPRIAEAAEMLARLFHPEAFSGRAP
jgi:iron complex transport system substrate-binding protein